MSVPSKWEMACEAQKRNAHPDYVIRLFKAAAAEAIQYAAELIHELAELRKGGPDIREPESLATSTETAQAPQSPSIPIHGLGGSIKENGAV